MAKPPVEKVSDADRKAATGSGLANEAAEKIDDRRSYEEFISRKLAKDPNAEIPSFEEWQRQRTLDEDEQNSGSIIDALF